METVGQLVAEELRGDYVPADIDCIGFSAGDAPSMLCAGDTLEHRTYGGQIVVRFYVNANEDNERYPRWYVDMGGDPQYPLYQTVGHVLDMVAARVCRVIPAST